MMKKLKNLKKKTCVWNKLNKESPNNSKTKLKAELAKLDSVIDKDEGDDDVVNKRTNVVRSLQDLEKLQSLEAARKAKIKWAIEGDENSKYYHGMFNGITLGSSLLLSHMFYVDDAMFVGQWLRINMSKRKLMGIRINMSKRKLMGIYVDADKVDQVARKIGCVTLKTPFTYLGSKVGGLMSRIQSWNETMNHSKLGYSFGQDPRGCVEQDQFDLMLTKVDGTLLVDKRDRWVWSLEGSGEFSVASVRKLIDDNMLSEVASQTHWIKAVPIKVNVHA
nr:RNA-directed DNA polymerase, eukaryota [Tanacetum cinerariifolium]